MTGLNLRPHSFLESFGYISKEEVQPNKFILVNISGGSPAPGAKLMMSYLPEGRNTFIPAWYSLGWITPIRVMDRDEAERQYKYFEENGFEEYC